MRAILLATAALNGLAAVALGAAGRHLWAGNAQAVALVETGVRYGLPHTAVLIALAALVAPSATLARRLLAAAGASLALGTTLFSGGVYALAAGAGAALGPIVPIGGSLMILGWVLLLVLAAVWPRRP